ncbi:MAG: thiamine pyrophosphate-dependent enzyme [Pseudaminobacter sp.]
MNGYVEGDRGAAGGGAGVVSHRPDRGLEFYKRIHFIRAFEQRVWDLSAEKPSLVAGSTHLCAGQEAVPVGAAAALEERDRVVATYRGHGWALEFGVTPYELLAEICHKADGVNGGRAGSPLVMAPRSGFIGENSIVGAGCPVATGVAMAQLHRGDGGVTVVTIGDGATSQGSVHEAMVFAVSRKLPVIFVVEHNGWSEMTPTESIIPLDNLARRAQAYGMPGQTIDGADPLVVRDAMQAAVERARRGEGPILLECRVSRLWGHYNRDIEHYRSKADKAVAAALDPLTLLGERLVSSGICTVDELASLRAQNDREIDDLTGRVRGAADPDPRSARRHIVQEALRVKVRSTAAIEARELTYIQAVNEAMRHALAASPDVVVYGEDCGGAGGIFAATRYLQRDFGPARVFDTPIAESAILGSAVGAAMEGMRPVVEIMWADFMLVALDQIVNQAANIRYVTGGACSAPLVIRMQHGATPGSCAQHSQCLEALLCHVPGLKVGLPADAQDAYSMLVAAIADPDPTIIIEARALYPEKMIVEVGGSPEPVGGARWRRRGGDLTLVVWSTAVPLALKAADMLSVRGVEAGVLDLRWLSPIDDEAIAQAVKQGSGRIVIVHEANRTGGMGAEIASRIMERHWTEMKSPVERVAAPDTRMPASPVLQAALLPSPEKIVEAALRSIQKEGEYA